MVVLVLLLIFFFFAIKTNKFINFGFVFHFFKHFFQHFFLIYSVKRYTISPTLTCQPSPAPQYGKRDFVLQSIIDTHTTKHTHMKQIPCQRQQQLSPGISPALAYSWLSRWASSAPQFLVPPGAQHARSGQLQGQGFSLGAVFTTEFTQQRMTGGGRNHRAHLRMQSTNMKWTVTEVDAAQCMVRAGEEIYYCFCFFFFSLFNTLFNNNMCLYNTSSSIFQSVDFQVHVTAAACVQLMLIYLYLFLFFNYSHRSDST